MRPLQLRVRGLTAFGAPVEIDLRDLPPGLVSVVGGNGSGKTTLLEAMGPLPLYLELPSRGGALKDWFNRRDGEVDLTFEYAGSTWRSLLQVDPEYSAGRGRTEAFLWRDQKPLNDGKVRTYSEAVAAHLPCREVFLASAFAAQDGTGNFLALGEGDRKALFASLLGLAELQTLADRARDHRRPLDAIASRLDDEDARLRADQETATLLRSQLGLAQAGVTACEVEGVPLDAAFAEAQATEAARRAEHDRLDAERVDALRRHREAVARQEAAAVELRRLGDDLAACRVALQAATTIEAEADEHQALTIERATVVGAVDDLTREATRLHSDWKLAQARAEKASRELEEAAAQAETLARRQARLDELGGAERSHEAAQAALQAAEAEHARALAVAGDALRSANDRHARATITAATAHSLVQQAERQAALLEGVPCRGSRVLVFDPPILTGSDPMVIGPVTASTQSCREADCGSCRFLVEARSARDDLPRLREAAEAADQELLDATATVASARSLQAAADEVAVRLPELRRAEATLRTQAVEAQGLQDLVRTLAMAPGRVDDLRGLLQHERDQATRYLEEYRGAYAKIEPAQARVDQVRARLQELATAPGALRRLQEARGREPALVDAEAGAVRALDAARAAVAGIDVPPAPQAAQAALQAARAARATAAQQVGLWRDRLAKARDHVSGLLGRLEQLGDLGARSTALASRRETVVMRRQGLVLLERAFGRDGIQALEIDAAGPEVATICNDLLEAVSGGRFTVELITIQEAGGGRVQKEVFDLRVHDGLAGGVRTHGGLSGGEQVLVSEALKLALAVFNARRWGSPIETLWRDECDGALEPAAAAAYPSMLRRALALSGARNAYFITHRPDVAAQADFALRVAGGRAWLEAQT